MKRKLTAKIQKLNPTHQGTTTKAFAQSLVIEPETRKLALQKGTIYAVYDISSDLELEHSVISKIVHDILRDLYFQSENISPTQTLEKTILEIRNKVTQMDETSKTRFNIVAAVLWGNVLYSVQFGSGKSYLVQEGEIRPISTISEGNFAAASGVVNDDDVVILSTESFDNEFPPKKLLSSSIPENNLAAQQAAILMKFIVDTEFSENEIVDFGLEETKRKGNLSQKIKNLFKKLTNAIKKGRLQAKSTNMSNRKLIIIIGLTVLLIPIAVLIVKKSKKTEEPTEPAQEQLLGMDIKRETNTWEEEKKNDEKNKVVRISPEAFFDIKIIDDTTDPTEIEVVDEKIIVAAKDSGKIFISEMETPNFEKTNLEFPGVESLNSSKSALSFNDNEGFKYFNIETAEVDESYEDPDLTLTDTYMDFIYAIKGNQIIKFTKENGYLSNTVWSDDERFSNAVSLSIAYSIFVTTKDSSILKYTAGEFDPFEHTKLEIPLGPRIKIFSDTLLNDIYILDPDNKRVVIFNDSGELIKQYKTEKEETWNNMKDISVSDDEKYIYVLNDTKIYVIGLDVEEFEEEAETEESPQVEESVDTTENTYTNTSTDNVEVGDTSAGITE
ncbi:hypothetical protein JXA34_03675 [Patescibacteria group bacterium]|nr:hypothetical protein [Patescibacteria group bacterium]